MIDRRLAADVVAGLIVNRGGVRGKTVTEEVVSCVCAKGWTCRRAKLARIGFDARSRKGKHERL